MYTEIDLLAFNYWNNLSQEDRFKLLQENCFWSGFMNYRYEHIPEDLKNIIKLKIDSNGLK